jgi:hypothetical protein
LPGQVLRNGAAHSIGLFRRGHCDRANNIFSQMRCSLDRRQCYLSGHAGCGGGGSGGYFGSLLRILGQGCFENVEKIGRLVFNIRQLGFERCHLGFRQRCVGRRYSRGKRYHRKRQDCGNSYPSNTEAIAFHRRPPDRDELRKNCVIRPLI